jgi:hypothetical protein
MHPADCLTIRTQDGEGILAGAVDAVRLPNAELLVDIVIDSQLHRVRGSGSDQLTWDSSTRVIMRSPSGEWATTSPRHGVGVIPPKAVIVLDNESLVVEQM